MNESEIKMEKIINETVKQLKAGKIILYPTDTIWGIGCDATNSKVVGKIFKLKQRVESKTMIVLLDSTDRLKDYMDEVPDIAPDLINSVETPLTVVFPNAKNLAKNLIADDKTVAIRVVRSEFCKQLIQRLGHPIVSSSANISGRSAPVHFGKISDEIKNGVDYIVDLEQDSVKEVKPSTIIKLEKDGEFKIIRS